MTGLAVLLLTGSLAIFYGLEFFPSKSKVKLGLMLPLWLLQTVAILWWVKTLPLQGVGKIALWIAAGVIIVASLLYCFGSTAPSSDREQVKEFVLDGKRVELYHLDRHDHLALELFYGTDGLLAKRHYQDHFKIGEAAVDNNRLTIEPVLGGKTLTLDLQTMTLISND